MKTIKEMTNSELFNLLETVKLVSSADAKKLYLEVKQEIDDRVKEDERRKQQELDEKRKKREEQKNTLIYLQKQVIGKYFTEKGDNKQYFYEVIGVLKEKAIVNFIEVNGETLTKRFINHYVMIEDLIKCKEISLDEFIKHTEHLHSNDYGKFAKHYTSNFNDVFKTIENMMNRNGVIWG